MSTSKAALSAGVGMMLMAMAASGEVPVPRKDEDEKSPRDTTDSDYNAVARVKEMFPQQSGAESVRPPAKEPRKFSRWANVRNKFGRVEKVDKSRVSLNAKAWPADSTQE